MRGPGPRPRAAAYVKAGSAAHTAALSERSWELPLRMSGDLQLLQVLRK